MNDLLNNLPTVRVAVLASGNGGNAENLILNIHDKIFDCNDSVIYDRHLVRHGAVDFVNSRRIEVVCVLSNVRDAGVLSRARNLRVRTEVIEKSDFPNRVSFDMYMSSFLKGLSPNFILLAGFMHILSVDFLESMSGVSILNIHPSFLPMHKGMHAIENSYADDCDFGGVSVHYVNEHVDSGDIIIQEKIQKVDSESLYDYSSRIHSLEYILYPKAFVIALKSKYGTP